MRDIATGSTTGTGAAINISLGWTPDYVRVVNVTDGDTVHEWFSSMTSGHAIKIVTEVAKITSNGISAYAGSQSAAPGFTLGTDVSESGKTLAYLAVRQR